MLLARLTSHGLHVRIKENGKLGVSGLRKLPPSLAHGIRDFITANHDNIKNEITEGRPGASIVAAREMLDLAEQNMLFLYSSGRGDLWPGLPQKYNDAKTWDFVYTLWFEGFEVLFVWLDSGDLDHVLNPEPEKSQDAPQPAVVAEQKKRHEKRMSLFQAEGSPGSESSG